ncbi:MAG TPA: hypothetical protein VGD99_17145 [Anaerolineae bacterium]|jgi:hypothetical protein
MSRLSNSRRAKVEAHRVRALAAPTPHPTARPPHLMTAGGVFQARWGVNRRSEPLTQRMINREKTWQVSETCQVWVRANPLS